jgi:hypothetical protein
MAAPIPIPSTTVTVYVPVPTSDHGVLFGLPNGDLATWVVGLLTAGTLLLGFYILLRDRRKEESRQAARIAAWADPDSIGRTKVGDTLDVTVYNGSDSVVTSIRVLLTHTPPYDPQLTLPPWIRKFRNRLQSRQDRLFAMKSLAAVAGDGDDRVLAPGSRLRKRFIVSADFPISRSQIIVDFTDSSGSRWRLRFKEGLERIR